ncbi:MAG: glycosyltransferase family 4 protein [Alcaligenaceae bacterium]|nr:glycosyltransferase family 4 protein [Alcaligenaceae bacterium]
MTKKLKLLITDIHHGNGGGHVTYIINLLRQLRDTVDITLAVPPSGRLYRYASQETGVRVLPGLYTSRLPVLVREVRQLHRFLASEQFDVIHVNGSADHRHAMLARIGQSSVPAIVWTKHNLHRASSVGHTLRARFGTNAVIAVSDYVARFLEPTPYHRCPIHVIRHGIDTRHFAPVSTAQKQALQQRWFGRPLPHDALVFGSTGGTDYEKGWGDLVAAVAALSPGHLARIHILVAGDPPSPDLRQRLGIDRLGDRLVFPGLVDDIRDVLGACDAGFVLSHKEALSYACRESLSMGLPTLVSNAGGLPENLSDGLQGWIVPVGSVPAITNVLQAILTGQCDLAAQAAAARDHAVTTFSEADFALTTLNVYNAVAKRLQSV